MQDQMKELRQLYQEYIDQCRILASREPLGARLLSTGRDVRNHPCHQTFYEDVERLLRRFLKEGVQDGEGLLRWMLEAPCLHPEEDARWYLLAVQKHAALLIPGLDPITRKRVRRWFTRLVPGHQRVPVQDDLMNMLAR